MAKNEFLPFGTAEGANVLAAPEYENLAARHNGFTSGVAKSKELNKVWRQASVMASVLAQFIVDTDKKDLLDDGDAPAVKNRLVSAMKEAFKSEMPAVPKTVQTTGDSATDVMSQKAVTEALGKKAPSNVADGKLAKDQNGADIPDKPKFIENLGLPGKYLSLSGGTITGATTISRSWEALKIAATTAGGAHFIRLADTGGNTASLGFLSDNSSNLSLNNEKTSTMFHVADGEVRVNSKRCLTTDDLSAAVPVGGSVIWNSSSPIPANFWKHDGRSFSAAEYPEAAKVFTDLKVPKDGGYFLRITDDGAGVDPGRQVGTYQEDAARKLEGKIALRSVGNAGEALYFPTGAFNTAKPAGINARAMSPMNDDVNNGGMDLLIDSSRVWPTASEFRPKNVSKYLIVRMK